MPPTAYIVHSSPGRIRLRVPTRRGDRPYFAAVVRHLAPHPAIREVRADPRTASLVVHHTGLAGIVHALAAEAELFVRAETEVAAAPSALPGILDATAAGLSGLALAQAARGDVLGSAAENFWNAYGSARVLKRPHLAAAFGAAGLVQLLRGEFLGSATALIFYATLIAARAEHSRTTGNGDSPGPA